MQEQQPTQPSIMKHRALTEERLVGLLQGAESSVTLDTVVALIFEGEVPDFRAYVTAMLSALNCDVDDVDDAAVEVIQDAWNYLPHRFLNGRCPAEVMMEETKCDIIVP